MKGLIKEDDATIINICAPGIGLLQYAQYISM